MRGIRCEAAAKSTFLLYRNDLVPYFFHNKNQVSPIRSCPNQN